MKSVLMFAAAAAIGIAQEGPDTMIFHKQVAEAGHRVSLAYVSADVSTESKPVKGAPYSAETVNENIQVLADGNRIVHKNSGVIYRDSEGRMRREQTIDAIGPWSTSGEPMKSIVINDTVTGKTYFLDSTSKEAHSLPVMPLPGMPGPGMAVAAAGAVGFSTGPADVLKLKAEARIVDDGVKSESLGKQTIEGLVCEGTRTTTTIPQGAMGNERPIEMVNERWYSPELQVVVLSKHSDPRMGQSTYKLQGVSQCGAPALVVRSPFRLRSLDGRSEDGDRLKFESQAESVGALKSRPHFPEFHSQAHPVHRDGLEHDWNSAGESSFRRKSPVSGLTNNGSATTDASPNSGMSPFGFQSRLLPSMRLCACHGSLMSLPCVQYRMFSRTAAIVRPSSCMRIRSFLDSAKMLLTTSLSRPL